MVLSILPTYINSFNFTIIAKGWYYYPHLKDRKLRFKMIMALAQHYTPGEWQSWGPGCWPPVFSTPVLSRTSLRRDGQNEAKEYKMTRKVTQSDTLEKGKRLGVWKTVLIRLPDKFGTLSNIYFQRLNWGWAPEISRACSHFLHCKMAPVTSTSADCRENQVSTANVPSGSSTETR